MQSKMRTIATGFAVASGLFLLIVLQGAGNGIINTFEESMGNFAFDAINVYGGRTTMPYEGIKEGREIRLDKRDVDMVKSAFPHKVSDIMPVAEVSGGMASRDGKYSSGTISGVMPDYRITGAIKITKGRFINNIDIADERKVIVISDRQQADLYRKNEEPINSIINIGNVCYKVIGIYKADEMRNSNTIYAPYSTISTIYQKGEFIDELTMRIKNIPTEADMETFIDEYTRVSSRIHSFNPEDKSALWVWNQARDNIQMQMAENILHNAFWILGLLTLISGIVGVSNIMLISVKERIREFGIRRAIGARPWNIISMVMLESIIITAVFGYIGMTIGVLFCEWMDATVGNTTVDVGYMQQRVFVNPTVDISTCVSATVIIIIAGALAGFFPARKAVKVKPIDALRG